MKYTGFRYVSIDDKSDVEICRSIVAMRRLLTEYDLPEFKSKNQRVKRILQQHIAVLTQRVCKPKKEK